MSITLATTGASRDTCGAYRNAVRDVSNALYRIAVDGDIPCQTRITLLRMVLIALDNDHREPYVCRIRAMGVTYRNAVLGRLGVSEPADDTPLRRVVDEVAALVVNAITDATIAFRSKELLP